MPTGRGADPAGLDPDRRRVRPAARRPAARGARAHDPRRRHLQPARARLALGPEPDPGRAGRADRAADPGPRRRRCTGRPRGRRPGLGRLPPAPAHRRVRRRPPRRALPRPRARRGQQRACGVPGPDQPARPLLRSGRSRSRSPTRSGSRAAAGSSATPDEVTICPRVHELRPPPGAPGRLRSASPFAVRFHAPAVDGEEFLTLREYEVGDDLRRIHWRSTARTGELVVREDEAQWQPRASCCSTPGPARTTRRRSRPRSRRPRRSSPGSSAACCRSRSSRPTGARSA